MDNVIYRTKKCALILIMTGFWKTDQSVTLGLFNLIAPANSHTHTLSMPCCINLPGLADWYLEWVLLTI